MPSPLAEDQDDCCPHGNHVMSNCAECYIEMMEEALLCQGDMPLEGPGEREEA